MEDDINTANALGAIFELIKEINSNTDENSSVEFLKGLYDLYMMLCSVLGLCLKEREEELLEEDILKLIEERNQARKNKDFALADKIRDDLKEKNIVLEDTRSGVKWHREN